MGYTRTSACASALTSADEARTGSGIHLDAAVHELPAVKPRLPPDSPLSLSRAAVRLEAGGRCCKDLLPTTNNAMDQEEPSSPSPVLLHREQRRPSYEKVKDSRRCARLSYEGKINMSTMHAPCSIASSVRSLTAPSMDIHNDKIDPQLQ